MIPTFRKINISFFGWKTANETSLLQSNSIYFIETVLGLETECSKDHEITSLQAMIDRACLLESSSSSLLCMGSCHPNFITTFNNLTRVKCIYSIMSNQPTRNLFSSGWLLVMLYPPLDAKHAISPAPPLSKPPPKVGAQ